MSIARKVHTANNMIVKGIIFLWPYKDPLHMTQLIDITNTAIYKEAKKRGKTYKDGTIRYEQIYIQTFKKN